MKLSLEQWYLPISLKQIRFIHELCRPNLVDTIIDLQKWKCIRLGDTVDLIKTEQILRVLPALETSRHTCDCSSLVLFQL